METTEPMETRGMDDAAFTVISKALADARRFEILEIIAQGEEGKEVYCSTVMARFDLSQPTISHHLTQLTAAGLITAHRRGQFMAYTPCRETIAAYRAELARRLLA